MTTTNTTAPRGFATSPRDPRLGPWGIYSAEGTDRVGLAQALRDTADHLAHGIPHFRASDVRLRATTEVDRLRAEAGRLAAQSSAA